MSELTLVYMPLSELRPADRNPKKHAMDGIKASLRRFGLFDAAGLLDGRTGKLYGGHGRIQGLRDMQRAGESAPSGVQGGGTEWMVPVMVGWSSRDDAEAEAVLMAANQHTIAGGWERDLLDAMLVDIHAADFAIEEVGFPNWPDDDEDDETERKLPTLGWKVVVDCADEDEQRATLDALTEQGYKATAVFT